MKKQKTMRRFKKLWLLIFAFYIRIKLEKYERVIPVE